MSPSKKTSYVDVAAQSGAVMIELTLAFGFLIFLFLATLEYVRAIQLKQNISVIVREAASAAFRECAEFDPDPALAISPVQTCVEEVGTTFQSQSRFLTPGGVALNITVFQGDPTNPNTPPATLGFFSPAGNPPTRFGPAFFTTGPHAIKRRALVSDQGRVVVAEVHAKFQFILGAAMSHLNPDFYDLAIY